MKLLIPSFWRYRTFLSYLLLPLSWLYVFFSYLKLYKVYVPQACVVTIGNITMGGAGKTPVALSIAQELKNIYKNRKIIILTRGYLGSMKGPIIAQNNKHSFLELGDEAAMIVDKFPLCISKNRLKGIKFLEQLGYDIIITDDGFQDHRFEKRLNILVIDSNFVFGNRFICPAGPLRQSIHSGFKEADFIVTVGDEAINLEAEVPVLQAKLVSKRSFKHKHKYLAFSGIGNPEKFFSTLENCGLNIITKTTFPDHHQYSEAELYKLIEIARANKAKLITTEKDYMRITSKFKQDIEMLPVNLVWEKNNLLTQYLINACVNS